jgi:hypothetical protein
MSDFQAMHRHDVIMLRKRSCPRWFEKYRPLFSQIHRTDPSHSRSAILIETAITAPDDFRAALRCAMIDRNNDLWISSTVGPAPKGLEVQATI